MFASYLITAIIATYCTVKSNYNKLEFHKCNKVM